MSPITLQSRETRPHEAAKARGQENAALQHERNPAKDGVARTEPAAIMALGASGIARGRGRETDAAAVYSRMHCAAQERHCADTEGSPRRTHEAKGSSAQSRTAEVVAVPKGEGASGTLVIGDDSHVQINSRGGSGSGTLIVGDRSDVHINSRGGSGSGTLVVGDDSHVQINSRGDSGSGTLIVGDRSDVHINSGGNVAGTLVVGDDAVVHVASRRPGAFSIEEGSRMYVGCDFESRRLAGGVATPSCTAQPQGHRQWKELHGRGANAKQSPELDLSDEWSKHKPAEYTDPRLEVMRALLESMDRSRKDQDEERAVGKWHRHDDTESGSEPARSRGEKARAVGLLAE